MFTSVGEFLFFMFRQTNEQTNNQINRNYEQKKRTNKQNLQTNKQTETTNKQTYRNY